MGVHRKRGRIRPSELRSCVVLIRSGACLPAVRFGRVRMLRFTCRVDKPITQLSSACVIGSVKRFSSENSNKHGGRTSRKEAG